MTSRYHNTSKQHVELNKRFFWQDFNLVPFCRLRLHSVHNQYESSLSTTNSACRHPHNAPPRSTCKHWCVPDIWHMHVQACTPRHCCPPPSAAMDAVLASAASQSPWKQCTLSQHSNKPHCPKHTNMKFTLCDAHTYTRQQQPMNAHLPLLLANAQSQLPLCDSLIRSHSPRVAAFHALCITHP